MTSGAHHLARLAEEAFTRFGDRDVLYFEGRWYRSGELLQRSRRLAGGLVARGIAPGDRVVVTMANTPEVNVLYSALWRAGAVVTPAIFLLSEAELRHILVDSEARMVVTSPEFLPTVRRAVDGAASVEHLVCSGSDHDAVPLGELEAGDPVDVVPRDDTDLAALMYTGGTTGRAKGVMLSHRNLWEAGAAAQQASYVPGITRSLVSLPLSHAFGLLVTAVGLHAVEPGTTVLMRWFDPAGFLRLVAEHRVQLAPVVPAMLQLLLSSPLEEYDVSSLRYVTCGAAPLAPEVLAEVERRLPQVEVLEGYGLTETAGIVSANRPGRRRLGSVGEPVPGCRVRILDDDGRPVAAGEVGEICVRSPTVMPGYWKAPELTAATVVDGWLHTGDIGRVDADGYLYVVDRKKDLIIRNGFNVYPRDVEDVLLEHPAVQLAAVVGRADPVCGEEVVAFVSLVPGASVTGEELVAFARSRLAAHKYPREVHVLAQVPLTAVGKVDRKAVRALARQQTAPAAAAPESEAGRRTTAP